ncbi:biogenesis of lysosome-related organelles complex 1 subunit 3 [Biomphalaria glabrata]|nr:biogenesis of lysosome-related organelles complex 1 subunit 3 [Biomphalaria glabrata]
MDRSYKTVVQGEASESEDDVSDDEPKAIVVAGEASESDEEEIDTSLHQYKKELPPLKVIEHSVSYESVDDVAGLSIKQSGKPKYDTILNKKLWESNLSLYNNLNGLVSHTYLSAAKDINNCGQMLTKSHAQIQDVSHHMRLMTNDLFNLQDAIDIITTCTILPNLKIPDKTPTASAKSEPSPHLDNPVTTASSSLTLAQEPQP